MSNPHYFFCEGLASISVMPKQLTADEWWTAKQAFAAKAADVMKSDPESHVFCFRIYGNCQHAGVFWHDELASSEGSSYMVLPGSANTADEIAECVAHIRRTQDVVRLRVLEPVRWAKLTFDESTRTFEVSLLDEGERRQAVTVSKSAPALPTPPKSKGAAGLSK